MNLNGGYVMNMSHIIYCSIFLLVALDVRAGLIDFETTASGGLPTDNGTVEFNDAFMADSVIVRFGYIREKIAHQRSSPTFDIDSYYSCNYDINLTDNRLNKCVFDTKEYTINC